MPTPFSSEEDMGTIKQDNHFGKLDFISRDSPAD